MTASSPPPSLPWRENPGHRRWLRAEADALFAFFERKGKDLGPILDARDAVRRVASG